jgi:integrase/recombinase XerD
MIEYNSLNERLKKQYEDALLHENYREQRTADAVWKAINLFEDFTGKADFTTFNAEQAKGFKRWLVKQENGKGELLSLSTVRSTLKQLRDFFGWLAIHPQYIRKIDARAVAYLRLSNNAERAGRATRSLPVPTVEEVRLVLETMPHATQIEKRDRAIIAFMALTCVRDAALISLKMKDVDREKKEVWQDPKHVKTKNGKAISTFFMPFDPLWQEIVMEWLEYAEKELSFKPNDPLFPQTEIKCNPATLQFEVTGLTRQHWANATSVRKIFLAAFTAAGLSYYNPHSFRKTLIIWSMEHCSQMEFKAISQNIGHENAVTSYNSYGTLNDHKRRSVIQAVGKGKTDISHVPDDIVIAEMQRRMQR